jgi:hypothetical protein
VATSPSGADAHAPVVTAISRSTWDRLAAFEDFNLRPIFDHDIADKLFFVVFDVQPRVGPCNLYTGSTLNCLN